MRATETGSYAATGSTEEPESIGLIERKQPGVLDPEMIGNGHSAPYDSRSSTPSHSGTLTPRRTYEPAVDKDGAAIHPEPLEVSKRLRALIDTPEVQKAPPPLLLSPQIGVSTSRTLQVRHSDSSDGDMQSSSSEDETDPSATTDHLALPSTSYQMQLMNKHSIDVLQIGQHEVDVDFDDNEEAALALEANHLSNGGHSEMGRTADQAGAILGIANIFVVLPQCKYPAISQHNWTLRLTTSKFSSHILHLLCCCKLDRLPVFFTY